MSKKIILLMFLTFIFIIKGYFTVLQPEKLVNSGIKTYEINNNLSYSGSEKQTSIYRSIIFGKIQTPTFILENNQTILDKDCTFIEYHNVSNTNNLIQLNCNGMFHEVKKAYDILIQHKDFTIKSMTFVDNRRWKIKLIYNPVSTTKEITIEFPAGNLDMERLKYLQLKHKILSRFTWIDLRFGDKLLVLD